MADDPVAVLGVGSKLVDCSSLTVAGQTVDRQRIIVASPLNVSGFAEVLNVPPGTTQYGMVTRSIDIVDGPTDGSAAPQFAGMTGLFSAPGIGGDGSLRPALAGPDGAQVVTNQREDGIFEPFKIIQGNGSGAAPATWGTTDTSDGADGATAPITRTTVAGIDQSSNIASLQMRNGSVQVLVTNALSGGFTVLNTVAVSGGITVLNPLLAVSGAVTVSNPISLSGNVSVLPAIPSVTRLSAVVVNISASGDTTLIAGATSQTIRIMRALLVVNWAGSPLDQITFKDSTPTNFTGPMGFNNGAITLDDSGEPWYVTAAGKGFIINQTQAGQISGTVWYTQS